MKRLMSVALFSLVMVHVGRSSTIRVPADYATVQAAVDAAGNGDEIIVSPGVYVTTNTLNIHRRITLRSTFDGSDWTIVKSTVIMPSGGFSLISIQATQGDGSTLRGLTVTRDPITNPPPGAGAFGIVSSFGASATIEYNIIENHVNTPDALGHGGFGAAISGVSGVIQNNIIRNNRAASGVAIYGSSGTVRNNLIYGNGSTALSGTATAIGGSTVQLINNTIYDRGGIGFGAGAVINNIFWRDDDAPFLYAGLPPRNCIIKGVTGSGVEVITDDPKFVDPANGDFHLRAGSPAIDAGLTTTTTSAAKADLEGVQRGLKGVQVLRGDGSGMDIGAYEYKPKPVAVWLPGGGPDVIHAGDMLAVAWEMDPNVGGTAIQIQLWDDQRFVADFGAFFSPTGAAVEQLPLTAGYLLTDSHYYILGFSSFDHALAGQTPLMTILSLTNAASPADWSVYR